MTRGLSLFALCFAIETLLFLPPDILAVARHWGLLHRLTQTQYINEEIYFLRYYGFLIGARVFWAAIMLCLAGWLYRGGNRLQGYLGVTITSE